MTPREADALSNAEYRAFVAYQNAEVKARERAERRAAARRR